MIDSIKLHGFKKIKDLTLEGLTDVNFLVGENGSGKSSILEAVHFQWLISNNFKEFNPHLYPDSFFPESKKIEQLVEIAKSIKEMQANKPTQGQKIELRTLGKNDIFEFDFRINFSPAENLKIPWINQYYDHLNIENVPKIVNEIDELVFINNNVSWMDQKIIDILYSDINKTKTVLFPEGLEKTKNKDIKYFDNPLREVLSSNLFDFYRVVIPYLSNGFYKLGDEYINAFLRHFVDKQSMFIRTKLLTQFHLTDLTEFSFHEPVESFASGEIALFSLINLCCLSTRPHKQKIVLIDEPEINLHPRWQKYLPEIFNQLSKELNIQFIISTHSPFIISESVKYDKQKVYLIENGVCVNPQGSNRGGSKKLAMDMLGAGVDDILPQTIVICESEIRSTASDKPNFQHDAKIYQYLFGDLYDVGFYSAGSNEDVVKNGSNLKELVNLLFNSQKTDIELVLFADSDYLNVDNDRLESKYDKDVYKWRNTGDFNNLESILYHESVLEYFEEYFDIELDKFTPEKQKNDKHADNWFNENFSKIETLDPYFSDVINRNHWKSHFELFHLTRIIKSMGIDRSSIYWKLHECIFGD